jgi:hypothetical protein
LGRWGDGGEGDARGVRPKVLQCEVAAFFFVENVNDHVAEVGHDPMTERKTIHAERWNSMILFHGFLELVCDGFEVWLRGSGADDEKVCKCGDLPQVENHDVVRFFGVYGLGTEDGDLVSRWSLGGWHALRSFVRGGTEIAEERGCRNA